MKNPKEPTSKQAIKKYLKLCDKYGFPHFFADDFIKYQNGKKWAYNGKPIKNFLGTFINYSRCKRETLINNKNWHGENNENWDFTPAVLLGYKKPSCLQNKLYIERILLKVNNNETLTKEEKTKANSLKVFDLVKRLKEDEPNNENKKPLIIVCTKCGLRKFSYETEKTIFCQICGKHTLFVKSE